MDFRFDLALEALRDEVRAFLAEVLADAAGHLDPLDLSGLELAYETRIQQAAGRRGWLALTGPAKAVFDFEVARADAPLIDTAMTLAGGLVEAHGRGWQRDELLPAMAAGDVQVCTAYTEPGAGSDLTAIEATAAPVGRGWVLNGHKTLVTGAHKAAWCCTIARTAPAGVPAREAMTMFLVDLTATGVEVVRRPTMNGWTLDEVHFRDVELPASAVLGEPGRGWRQLVAAAASERTGMFWLGFAAHVLDLIVELVGRECPDDPVALDVLGRCAVAFADVDRLARRTVWTLAEGLPVGALPSMAKVAVTELLQELARAGTELAGTSGLAWGPLLSGEGRLAWEYLERVHGTISVGANEVQRDTIAQLGLGLPRER